MRSASSAAVSRMQASILATFLVVVALGVAYYSLRITRSQEQSGSTASSLSSASLSSSSSSAFSSLSSMSSGIGGNASWVTYHRDYMRSGYDSEINSFSSVKLDWKSVTLDGQVYAEPLVVGNQVIAATENDSVYSIDVSTGQVTWRTHLGEPVPRSDLPCGNIDPTGITGTPAVDTQSATIFVVAFLRQAHHELFALSLHDGTVRLHRGVDPSGSDPRVQQQRAALAVSRGYVYVAYGGLFGDCGSYHGWVVASKQDGSGSLLEYLVPAGRGGGIWGPSGPAIDQSGNLFVSTGNSFSTVKFDYGEGVIKLSPTLQVLDWFAPTVWSELNAEDTDIGSVGPAILGGNLLFQIGKEGVGYLLDGDKLGGVGGELFSSPVCSGAFGGTAYSDTLLFVPCVDGIVALSVKPGATPSFSVMWRAPGFDAGPPIVVGRAVWTVDVDSGAIYALDHTSGKVLFSSTLGPVAHFSTPSYGDGRIFVSANDEIFALKLIG